MAILSLTAQIGWLPAQSVPSLMNYQGQISNPDGGVPATADYELSFSIYDTDKGGNVVWGPQNFNGGTGRGLGLKVPVVQGYFNVTLGPEDTAGRSIDGIFGQATRYLEIKIGTNSPIAPRQQILAAPYAINSQKFAGHDWNEVAQLQERVAILENQVNVLKQKTSAISIAPEGHLVISHGPYDTVFQTDGNLCYYKRGFPVLWCVQDDMQKVNSLLNRTQFLGEDGRSYQISPNTLWQWLPNGNVVISRNNIWLWNSGTGQP